MTRRLYHISSNHLLCVRVPEDVFDSTTDVSLVAGDEGVPELQLLRQTLIEQLIISPTCLINFLEKKKASMMPIRNAI